MFVELKGLLAHRSLTITAATLPDNQIRVNVVPSSSPEDKKANEKISYSHKDEVAAIPEQAIQALTTPVSITGTPEEIDENLPQALSQYVESHVRLQDSLNRASSEIVEAVKAIDERNKAKKEKEKAGKKDVKNKAAEPKKKADDTLPLWWTDKSAISPGSTQPEQGSDGFPTNSNQQTEPVSANEV